MATVAQGGIYSWTATIRDGNGDLADCADLALTIADPDGDVLAGFPVISPAIVRDSLGEYHYDWFVAADADLGIYDADWAGTVSGLAVGGSDSVEVVLAGSILPFTAYASLNDLQTTLSRTEDDSTILNAMAQALVFGTERLIEELDGADFFRHPSTGTETWYVNGNDRARLHVHRGIVSLTTVRIRQTRRSDWVTLGETDYDLESLAAFDRNQAMAIVSPFDHVLLNGTGSYSRWPKGERLIEFTGARGWPAIPPRAVEANVAMARQLMAADRTYPGGVISPDEAGLPVLPGRLPDAVYRLKAWHSQLFAACAI